MGENRAVTFTPADVCDAAERIIAARDFCGSEREAFYDFCDDYGIQPTERFRDAAFYEANRQWDAWRKAAGVRL